ncbi:hypothetical protein I7I48_10898 [Histoplasma ohiense]|nr:hypothetical protein I7I48_10898 [Histoplasma ohiense (nom. inval.)]
MNGGWVNWPSFSLGKEIAFYGYSRFRGLSVSYFCLDCGERGERLTDQKVCDNLILTAMLLDAQAVAFHGAISYEQGFLPSFVINRLILLLLDISRHRCRQLFRWYSRAWLPNINVVDRVTKRIGGGYLLWPFNWESLDLEKRGEIVTC